MDTAGVERRHLRQVPLVVLQHQGQRGRVELVRDQVLGHLAEALHVLVPAVGGGVGHEHDGVGALEHQAPGRRVHRLAGHRRQLQPQVEPAEAGRLQRKQVEQDGAVLRGMDGDHLAPPLGNGVAVQDLQVGRLAAHGRAVVDDLDLDGPLSVVQLDHGRSRVPAGGEGARSGVSATGA
jgi:hypothetical protein